MKTCVNKTFKKSSKKCKKPKYHRSIIKMVSKIIPVFPKKNKMQMTASIHNRIK